ncbi:MAG: Fic family protein [Imperialibacter sp.]|uniref:Fic family protein n=1 Tax=Imperialibacter sp. TaxID=2038411 RepID=UPI0032EF6529
MRRLLPYIYQKASWPAFAWKQDQLTPLLGKVRHLQGKLVGKMESLGFVLQNEAVLETLTLDVLKSTEIEGQVLNPQQVRSSVARRLGLDISGLIPSDRDVDGVVDMMLDATQQYNSPLTKERLFAWHSSLFPTGRSGMYKVLVGNWRDDSTGPMQVVSGALGKEKVHFEAPPAKQVDDEMERFLLWLNENDSNDMVIKAAIAHLWFVTIHPFEDGNGRIARAIADMLLARADGMAQRFYSMSAQIRKERKAYYDILEKTQQGDVDITHWLDWFLNCLLNALNASYDVLDAVIFKHTFWSKNALLIDNERQKLMLDKLMDGFEGNLTTSKWAKITGCSADTALRDIQDLLAKQILQKAAGGGRSTNYLLVLNEGIDRSVEPTSINHHIA